MINQWSAIVDQIKQNPFHLFLSKRRVLVQFSNDFSAQDPEIVHVLADGFLESRKAMRCSRKGLKQATIFSPGAMSLSKPIQLRGQSSISL